LKKECCDSDYAIFGTKERRAKSKGKICFLTVFMRIFAYFTTVEAPSKRKFILARP